MTDLADTAPAWSIHPSTSLGPATLAVTDPERAIEFYRDLLGFTVLSFASTRIELGAGETHLLTLLPGATHPRKRGATGLYHVAILLPSRPHLAQILARLAAANYPIGAADHHVSEALYLSDPDDNGLEIYRDRPRSEWRYRPGGQLVMGTERLDAEGILGELPPEPWAGMPAGTTIGHMHLQVGDLQVAEQFYHGVLGFDVTVRGYPGALFLSAGGYHHHLGLNTWESANGPRAPLTAAGLRSFVVRLPDAAALAALRERISAAGLPLREHDGGLIVDDPWGNGVVLSTQ
jgi:catechol 2,3-dioxygenase